MSARWIYRCLVTLMLSLGLSGVALAADIKPTRTVLPNGLTVLTVDQPSLPIVSVAVLIKAGAVHDPEPLAGLSFMVAELLDEGTKSKSATEIAQAIEFIGGELNFAGGEDFTTGTLRVLKKDAELGLSVIADVLRNPTFPPKEVERIRSELLGALRAEKEQPSVIAEKAFDALVFQGHPYHRPPNGTEQTVARIAQKGLIQFYQTYYQPNRTILAVVGDVRDRDALALITKHFGSWPQKKTSVPEFPAAQPLAKAVVKVINKDLTQATVILGNVGIARSNPDYYAVMVMNYILGGGGFSSRLVNRIRDQLGLAYDVDSAFEADALPGPFTVRLQTRNAEAKKAIENVLQEIQRMRTQPVTDEELADAKAYLVGSFPLRFDTTGKLATLLTVIEFHGLGLSYFEDYPKAVMAVTKEDVLRVAQKYLPQTFALVVVAKEEEAKITPDVLP
jgi:zinc protease